VITLLEARDSSLHEAAKRGVFAEQAPEWRASAR
jgi:hypothetical protein